VDIGEQSDVWEGVAEGSMEAAFREEGVNLVLWNLEQTPYPLEAESFDAVVMTEVFEHLRDYPASSLVEVRRILRPDGRLYLTTPNAAYIGNRVRLALGKNVATPLNDWIGGVPFARHAREYTFDEMRILLRHAGLEPERMIGRHLHTRSGRTSPGAVCVKRAVNGLAALRPSLGPAVVAVARRPRVG
jgi:SAM-dependent methyltransferase